jgi:Thioesterase-like superfamily
MHNFDAAITLIQAADTPHRPSATALPSTAINRFLAQAHPAYWNFAGPFGGVTTGAVMAAIMRSPERAAVPLATPLAMTLNFIAPLLEGEYTIDTECTAQTRSTQHWNVTVRLTDGKPALTGSAVFATRRENAFSADELHFPDVMRADSKGSKPAGFPVPPQSVPLWPQQYDVRFVEGRPLQENPTSRSVTWLRDAPPRPLDWCALAAYCDTIFPRLYFRQNQLAPIATVSMTIHFHANQAELDAVGIAATVVAANARRFANGFYDHTGAIWRADEVLLATTEQVVWHRL